MGKNSPQCILIYNKNKTVFLQNVFVSKYLACNICYRYNPYSSGSSYSSSTNYGGSSNSYGGSSYGGSGSYGSYGSASAGSYGAGRLSPALGRPQPGVPPPIPAASSKPSLPNRPAPTIPNRPAPSLPPRPGAGGSSGPGNRPMQAPPGLVRIIHSI